MKQNAGTTKSRKLQPFTLSGSLEEGDNFYCLIRFTERKFNKWTLMVGEKLRRKPPATLVKEVNWDCRRNKTKKTELDFKINFLRSMIVKLNLLTINVQWSLKGCKLQSNVFIFWEFYGIYLFTHAEVSAVIFLNLIFKLRIFCFGLILELIVSVAINV